MGKRGGRERGWEREGLKEGGMGRKKREGEGERWKGRREERGRRESKSEREGGFSKLQMTSQGEGMGV